MLNNGRIREAARKYAAPNWLVEECILRGYDLNRAIHEFQKYSLRQNLIHGNNVEGISNNHQSPVERELKALIHNIMDPTFPYHGQFKGRTLGYFLNETGIVKPKPNESDDDFAKRSMSTSDLPTILANVGNNIAGDRYKLQPRTFGLWTRPDTLRDYKEAMQVRAGDFGALVERKELAEYQESFVGEDGTKVTLRQWGIIHSFSDRMVVNDSRGLRMIGKVISESGVAASRLENKLAYDVLKSNPVMADGYNVFSSQHGNDLSSSPSPLGEETFDAAFRIMRTQLSVDGRDPLNTTPKYLIVGPELETAAKKALTPYKPHETDDVNIFAGKMDLIIDNEIEDDKYFFVADPDELLSVVMYRLEGQELPQVQSRINWRNDSLQVKCSHVVAAGVVDHRGLIRGKAS